MCGVSITDPGMTPEHKDWTVWGLVATVPECPNRTLLDLTFPSGREGIDNPFIALIASSQFVCVGVWDFWGDE